MPRVTTGPTGSPSSNSKAKSSTSKTSASSTAKSIRDQFDEICGIKMASGKGWKTKREWIVTLNMQMRTFENRIAVLLERGLAKKQNMKSENGKIYSYYWINNLSDEDHG